MSKQSFISTDMSHSAAPEPRTPVLERLFSYDISQTVERLRRARSSVLCTYMYSDAIPRCPVAIRLTDLQHRSALGEIWTGRLFR